MEVKIPNCGSHGKAIALGFGVRRLDLRFSSARLDALSVINTSLNINNSNAKTF
ncbi:MAG: hypothetical protein WCI03_08830 [bacterium]